MRTIDLTRPFKRDYKSKESGVLGKKLDDVLRPVVTALASDVPLAERHRDHALSGKWKDCRDCHIRPDLILIYRRIGRETLELVRLGSHSELGL